MISESGTVIAVKDDEAWVQTIRTSACESCSARAACGQKVLAAATSGRANQICVKNRLDARVGDQVELGIPESTLLSASLLAYGLPLALMVLLAVMADAVWPGSDLAALIFGIGGLGIGLVLTKMAQGFGIGAYKANLEPTMLAIERTIERTNDRRSESS